MSTGKVFLTCHICNEEVVSNRNGNIESSINHHARTSKRHKFFISNAQNYCSSQKCTSKSTWSSSSFSTSRQSPEEEARSESEKYLRQTAPVKISKKFDEKGYVNGTVRAKLEVGFN